MCNKSVTEQSYYSNNLLSVSLLKWIQRVSSVLDLQRNKHVQLSGTSYNVIKWKGEMATMAFNNYLGKIFFLCHSQCKMCLHCVVSLWAIDTCESAFVQVMLIPAGHSPAICFLRKSSSQQCLTQWTAVWINSTTWRKTNVPSQKHFTFTGNQLEG